MAITFPTLEHKWIKLYNSSEEQQQDYEAGNYTECCYWIIKDPNANESNELTYQYSVRTTNNDNEKLGHYYSVEEADNWSGLEIIWGYFGWEFIDYEYDGEQLLGGNFFEKITTSEVRSITDGDRLQHINNFLGSQNSITVIDTFDNSNIISAMNLNGYRPTDTNRQLTCHINDWENVKNAQGMFQNMQVTFDNNVLNLPKAIDCSYIFNSVSGNTITFNWSFPLAENLSYAFYNVQGDISPLNNNLFVQNNVTNVDYCFGSDNLSQINVNITELPAVTTAKGIFRGRMINNNNNNNNIQFLLCEYLDYALQECDLSKINNLTFTSNSLISSKGLLKGAIINNPSDTIYNSLQHLTNYNLVSCFDEYLSEINHDESNNKIKFDISNQTGSQDTVTLVDFCSNSNIQLQFVGNDKCSYDNFCTGGTIQMLPDSVLTGGKSYKNCFNGTTITGTLLPINDFDNSVEYENVYEGCTFNGTFDLNLGNNIVNIENVLKDCIIPNNFNFTNLTNNAFVRLNFSYTEVQNIFNYDISDNTSDYGYDSDYIGYKQFYIDQQFNCKGLKTQTINVYSYNDEYNVDGGQPDKMKAKSIYLIDNDFVEDLSNVTINLEQNNNTENYGDGQIMKVYLKSNSMTKTPIINFNTRNKSCSLSVDSLPNLIEFNCSNCNSTDSRSNIRLDQNNLIYFRLGNFRGEVYLSSEILDIPTLEESILANNLGYYNFTIKRSIYNQITPSTLEILLDRSTQVSIIEN